jgi:threonine synthase
MQKILEKFKFRCVNCDSEYTEQEVKYLCPSCSVSNSPGSPPKGVLKLVYDHYLVKELMPNHSISFFDYLKSIHYISLLPISNIFSMPKLRVGNTPLYRKKRMNNKKLNFNLFLKDDSQNPTYSFKDRASALVSAYAKEHNIDKIVAASTGNAGSSLAGICASQNQKAVIMVPESAPIAKLTQIIMYGADIIPVKGSYDDAFDLSVAATEKFGWYNRNTAYNPLTVEGKKTVSFELFDQLNQNKPDRVFVPVGDGVIISGVYKGFEDLMNVGIINQMPVIIAVQSEGSDNLIRNITENTFTVRESSTLADSISVDVPRNFYMAKQFLEKYEGEYLSVSDDEILNASQQLSQETGLFAEPAAATSFAGFLRYYSDNRIKSNSTNIVLLTGSGLKDIKAFESTVKIPEAIEPNIDLLEKLLK